MPAGSLSAGHGYFNSGAPAVVISDSSTSLRVSLVKQIEYYFRQVKLLHPHCSCIVIEIVRVEFTVETQFLCTLQIPSLSS
jgi:hypothetical protein